MVNIHLLVVASCYNIVASVLLKFQPRHNFFPFLKCITFACVLTIQGVDPDSVRYGPDYTGCPDNMRYGPDCVGSIIDSSILPSVSNFLPRRLFEATKRPSLKPQELTQLKTPVFPSLSLSCSIM